MSGIFAGAAGALGNIVSAITLSGPLDATAVAGTANSATRTVTVPGGNSGMVSFGSYVDVGTVGLSKYNKNAAGLVNLSDATVVTFANGDSLLLQTLGDNAGESRTMTLTDVDTGTVIATVVHTGA